VATRIVWLAIGAAAGALAACGGSVNGSLTPHPSPIDPQTVKILGEAMVPLLDNGDTATVDRAAYRNSKPQRGDVVLMLAPNNPSRIFDKRVIAVPGDVVEIDGSHVDPGHPDAQPRTAVLIKPGGQGDWQVADEPYLPDQKADPWTDMNNCCDEAGRATSVPTPLTIPNAMYFVMGDNRNRSSDSRSIGLVPEAYILGKGLYRTRAGRTTWLYDEQLRLRPTS
jgi:signal peptidase I